VPSLLKVPESPALEFYTLSKIRPQMFILEAGHGDKVDWRV
jgi:hypothetical protein